MNNFGTSLIPIARIARGIVHVKRNAVHCMHDHVRRTHEATIVAKKNNKTFVINRIDV